MRVVFAGTPALVLPCFDALMASDEIEIVGVVSQPDRRSGRGMHLTASPVKQAAIDAGIDVITPTTLRNNEEALYWLQEKQADFLVVIAFGMILPKSWLDTAAIAPINLHASLLPRWRGAAPIERAILAGDHETGICVMHMDEGLDTGRVYASCKTKITNQTTVEDLRNTLLQSGATLLTEVLPQIAKGGVIPHSQVSGGVCYAEKLTREDRDIDWQQSAHIVGRKVRAFAPKPGALTRYNSKVLKVLAGEPIQRISSQQPGSIIHEDGNILIVCQESLYHIHQLQLEGKRVMGASDFIRGNAYTAGMRLG
ncbi:MAG: methionyl-tRNA formyltransferase [Mariprofundaceae bacterium]